MKHWLKLALALALALSMTACGGETNVENPDAGKDPNENVQQDTETPDDSETPEEPEVPSEPEIPDEPSEPEIPEEPETPNEDLPKEDISFDPYWAGDEFEMPIPEPPYSYEVEFRNGVYEISTLNSDEVLAGTVYDIKNYCETLKFVGYDINVNTVDVSGFTEDRPGFLFSARNSNGGYVELIYDGNGYKLFADISSVENIDEPEVPALDTSWASNAYEKLIPQPPFEGWEGSMKGSNVYELFTSKAKDGDSLSYYDVFQAYLDSLKALGFSIDGEVYSCNGSDKFGNRFEFKCGDGCAWITVMPVEDLSGNGGEKNPADEPEISDKTENGVSFDLGLDIDETQIEFLKNILPAGNWTVENNQNENYEVYYVLNCDGISFDNVNGFISKLDEQGFLIFEIIAFDGSYGEFQAEKGENDVLSIVNVQYDGNDSIVSISIMKRAI